MHSTSSDANVPRPNMCWQPRCHMYQIDIMHRLLHSGVYACILGSRCAVEHHSSREKARPQLVLNESAASKTQPETSN
jgi:hypothetical protein